MNYKFKTKPYAHQLKALEMSLDKDVFSVFMEMGTGKSKVLIDNVSMLYDKGKINGVVIVAPKGVYKNWHESEIPIHMANHVEYVSTLWQSNINKKQEKELSKLFKTGHELHILIVNVEALSTKKGVDFVTRFINCHETLMVIDESTTIKNPEAKRTKNICKLGRLTKYRRILTGAPVTKSPLDLFKQCEFLDPWLLGHQSYYGFRTRYAIMKTANFGGRSVQIVVGYRNIPELSEKLTGFSYRVLKDDCLDLPPKTYTKRIIQLTDEQQKLYSQMKKSALAVMNSKLSTTATAMTQLMRLQQITCGHFKSDDGVVQEIKNNRIVELMDTLEEIQGKVVIWAHWRNDIATIVKHIKEEYGDNSYVTYFGDTTVEDRQKAIKKIQDPKSSVRFIIGTPQTAGYGITLTGASTMIYYSNGYDLEKRMQSEARIDRIGQEMPMTYIDIMCEKTVDERIVKALRKKVNIATQVMGEELKAWI